MFRICVYLQILKAVKVCKISTLTYVLFILGDLYVVLLRILKNNF